MDNPKDDDIERLRYCPNCYDGDGPLCLHCELDVLFQVGYLLDVIFIYHVKFNISYLINR